MFGADIAYMDSCIDEEYVTDTLLPEYLYPTFRVPSPWHRQSNQTQLDCDIIVIAEFSELEGPKPVITIPNDREIHFNINDFTVRIMSVDQGSSGQQGFFMPEDSQVLMSDTKENVYAFVHHFVLLDKQARGYSRPFAISYVTPDQRKLLNFYEEISSNFKKIARFLKYGNKLVFKNDLDKFTMDLQYTKDQMVNRFRTTIQPGQTDHDNKLLQTLKILESQISEIQAVLGQLNPTLNDKRMEQRFSRIEERAQTNKYKQKYVHDSGSLCDWETIETPEDQIQFSSLGNTADTDNLLFFDSQHYKPKLVEITKGRKFDLHLRGLHELCSWGAKEGLQKLRHIYQYFHQDSAALQMEKSDLSLLNPQPGLVTFGNKFVAANFMTNIDKICISNSCYMRVQGSKTMESWNMLGRSWSSNDTLSSFKSLPNSFQSFVDENDDDDDSESMLSATSDLGYYLQRTNSMGSFHLVGSYDSFHNSMSPPKSGFMPDSNKSSLPDEPSVLTNTCNNLKQIVLANENTDIQESNCIEISNMEECVGELEDTLTKQESKLAELILKKKISDINKDDNLKSDLQDMCPEIVHDISNSINEIADDFVDSCERDRSTTLVFDVDASKVHNCSETIINEGDVRDGEITDLEPNDNNFLQPSAINDDCNANNKTNTDDLKKSSDPSAIENLGHLISNGQISCGSCPNLDMDSSSGVSSCSECNSKPSNLPTTEDNPVKQDSLSREGSNKDLETNNKTDIFKFSTQCDALSAGFGIMKAVQSYSYIQNIIYSLLIGRTVVVIGSAQYEEEIRSLVTALKIFLPGCHRCSNGCVLWSCKGINITDLIDIKLIGICRHEKKSVNRMIPKSVQKYITIFDVERRMIHSPVYQGSLITTILSRKKSFKTEESYINFIKVLLCDFSTKAFIFFHSFCLGSVGTVISMKPTVFGESDSTRRTATTFLNKLGVQDCDINIIEYLTEVVKYQHIEDHYKSISPTGVPPRPVTRTGCPCQIFKC